MALTGLCRGEIAGDERPRSNYSIHDFLNAKKEDEKKLRASVFQTLVEGKVSFVEIGQRTLRFSPNRKVIKVTSSDPNLPGLRIEEFHGDSITVKERSGRKPHSITLHPFLFTETQTGHQWQNGRANFSVLWRRALQKDHKIWKARQNPVYRTSTNVRKILREIRTRSG
jgi:hypothetical protein